MGEEVLDCISEAGFTKPLSSVSLSEKKDIVSTITPFYKGIITSVSSGMLLL